MLKRVRQYTGANVSDWCGKTSAFSSTQRRPRLICLILPSLVGIPKDFDHCVMAVEIIPQRPEMVVRRILRSLEYIQSLRTPENVANLMLFEASNYFRHLFWRGVTIVFDR